MTEGVLEFLRSRPISMLATRDAENRPSLHECILADIEDNHVIGLVPAHLARNLTENIANNGEAAIVVSRSPGDHRSVQLKGKITRVEEAKVRTERFAKAKIALAPMFTHYMPEGPARERIDLMTRQSVYLFRFDVREEFDQTPGPRAGRPIGAEAR